MFRFEHLDDVEAALRRLREHDRPLVTMLERQPGTKEARYRHLLSGEAQQQSASVSAPRSSAEGDRVERLESELAELRRRFEELRHEFNQFKKKFESEPQWT
jgi:uncharacterized protein YceH (UPF0502 family)